MVQITNIVISYNEWWMDLYRTHPWIIPMMMIGVIVYVGVTIFWTRKD